MQRSSNRALRLALFVAISLLAVAGLGSAQTPVSNPTTVAFPPSPDHSTLLADGRPLVSSYSFDVYSVGASQPFQRTDLGKPSPASDGWIYHDFSGELMSWPLPGGTYEARVGAVGPYGTGLSTASNPFTFTPATCSYALSGTSASLPAAGGGTQVTVTAAGGCAWTAASNASWISISTTSGTGTGTVVASVAANSSTSARTGTMTVAGTTFTINQAGAAVTGTAPGVPVTPAPSSGATGVTTTPTLTWQCTGASSYAVRLGTSNPPAQVASGLTAASYVPAALSAGATYYWQVTAANATGTSASAVWSFTTAAAPPPPSTVLPSPWVSRDLGSVGLPGSAGYANGTFTVTGSGADIWGTADSFQFTYQPLTGLNTIIARVTAQQAGTAMAKAGVMMREGSAGLVAGAGHAALTVRPDGTVEFISRGTTGGTTAVRGSTSQSMPVWLRLVRSSTTVTASVSSDGSAWRTVGSVSMSLSSKSLVGLAVTSHDTAQRDTATFTNVTVR